MKIAVMDGHREGKKATLINTPHIPQVMIKPPLKYIQSLQRQFHPQPVTLLTNSASKLELPLVQTIVSS